MVFQTTAQPYPLYAAVVAVSKENDQPWESHGAWTALVVGWNHYPGKGGKRPYALPLLADKGAPQEFGTDRCPQFEDFLFFAPSEEEAFFLAESHGAERAALLNSQNCQALHCAKPSADPFA